MEREDGSGNVRLERTVRLTFGYSIPRFESCVLFAPDTRTRWQKFMCWWLDECWYPVVLPALMLTGAIMAFRVALFFMFGA